MPGYYKCMNFYMCIGIGGICDILVIVYISISIIVFTISVIIDHITPHSYYLLTHVYHGVVWNKLQCEPTKLVLCQSELGLAWQNEVGWLKEAWVLPQCKHILRWPNCGSVIKHTLQTSRWVVVSHDAKNKLHAMHLQAYVTTTVSYLHRWKL